MKAKCINSNNLPYGESLIEGKIYNAEYFSNYDILVKNEQGYDLCYKKERFQIFENELECLKLELEQTESRAKELKEKIEKLSAERLKVGQVWEHIDHQEKYLLTHIGSEYTLVCTEGYFVGHIYAALTEKIENVFCGMKELFELQK